MCMAHVAILSRLCTYLSGHTRCVSVTLYHKLENEGVIILTLPYLCPQSQVKMLMVFKGSLLDRRPPSGSGDTHLCQRVLVRTPGEFSMC